MVRGPAKGGVRAFSPVGWSVYLGLLLIAAVLVVLFLWYLPTALVAAAGWIGWTSTPAVWWGEPTGWGQVLWPAIGLTFLYVLVLWWVHRHDKGPETWRTFDEALRADIRDHATRYFVLGLVGLVAVLMVSAVILSDNTQTGDGTRKELVWDGWVDPLIALLTLLFALGIYLADRAQIWEVQLPKRLDMHVRLVTDDGGSGKSQPILSLHRAELSGEGDIRTYAQSAIPRVASAMGIAESRADLLLYFDIERIGRVSSGSGLKGPGHPEPTGHVILYRITVFIGPGNREGKGNQYVPLWPVTDESELDPPKEAEQGSDDPEQNPLPEGWCLRLFPTGSEPAADGNVDPWKKHHVGYVVWDRLQADRPSHDTYYVDPRCVHGLDPQRGAGGGDECPTVLEPPSRDWFDKVREHLGAEDRSCNCVLQPTYSNQASLSDPGSRTELLKKGG